MRYYYVNLYKFDDGNKIFIEQKKTRDCFKCGKKHTTCFDDVMLQGDKGEFIDSLEDDIPFCLKCAKKVVTSSEKFKTMKEAKEYAKLLHTVEKL